MSEWKVDVARICVVLVDLPMLYILQRTKANKISMLLKLVLGEGLVRRSAGLSSVFTYLS